MKMFEKRKVVCCPLVNTCFLLFSIRILQVKGPLKLKGYSLVGVSHLW